MELQPGSVTTGRLRWISHRWQPVSMSRGVAVTAESVSEPSAPVSLSDMAEPVKLLVSQEPLRNHPPKTAGYLGLSLTAGSAG